MKWTKVNLTIHYCKSTRKYKCPSGRLGPTPMIGINHWVGLIQEIALQKRVFSLELYWPFNFRSTVYIQIEFELVNLDNNSLKTNCQHNLNTDDCLQGYLLEEVYQMNSPIIGMKLTSRLLDLFVVLHYI